MYQKLICHHYVALRWLDSVHLGGNSETACSLGDTLLNSCGSIPLCCRKQAAKSNPLDSIGCARVPERLCSLHAPPYDTTSQLHFRNAAWWYWQRAGATRMTRTFSIRKFTHICATCHVLFFGFPYKKWVAIMLWFCTFMMNQSSSNLSTGLWNTSDLLISVCLHPLWLMSIWNTSRSKHRCLSWQ